MAQNTHTQHYFPTLQLKHAAALYGYMPLYESLAFSLTEGAVLVISAPNGVGKTTCLKQLAGLHQTREMELSWFDQPIRTMRDYDGDAIYLGDRGGVYPHLTVRQQLQTFAQLWAGQEERIAPAVQYFSLQPYMDMRIAELSAGWKRRVALCRLLIIPALIWFLDEPMMHLDQDGVNLLGGMIHSHAQKGGVSVIAMPDYSGGHQLYDVPISVIDLQDFAPAYAELDDA